MDDGIKTRSCPLYSLTIAKGLGNTSDADLNERPSTIDKLIDKFRTLDIEIPGHGKSGGPELLKHTRELLNK
jgi:metallo-beta-lactamase class B